MFIALASLLSGLSGIREVVLAPAQSIAGLLPPALHPWFGGGLAFAAMLLLTPIVIRVAHGAGWLAHPKADRWHSRPVALMGGIAIFAATGLATVAAGGLEAYPWPVWLAGALVFGAGVADDLYDIRPEAKLVIQILATVLLLYAGLAFWRGGPFWVSVPLTFLWVIGITNSLNLLDGMDGLAAGIAAIAASVLGLIAWMLGIGEIATAAAAIAGASAGFLVFNFKPARIFMGDCGSMFLGFVLATVAMTVQGQGGPFAATLVPIVVLAVPIFDTTFVTVTRILNGTPVTQGGTDHTMHRLVLLGLSERRTVLTLYVVSAVFGLLTLAVYQSTAQLFYALVLLALVASVAFGLYLASARDTESSRDKPLVPSQRFGAVMQALFGGVAWKSLLGTVADLLLVGATFIAAHHLRFGATPPADAYDVMMTALPAVIGLKIGVFYLAGLYHGIWRHAGTPELVRLVGASTVASLLTYAGLAVTFGFADIAPAVIFIDWMLATGAVATVRLGFRGLRQYFAAQRSAEQSALIYGTGPNALLALRHLRQAPEMGRTVVGFLAESDARNGLRVQGLTVLGTLDRLHELCETYDVDEVIIATGDVPRSRRHEVRDRCIENGVVCRYFSLSLSPAPPFDAEGAHPASGDGAAPSPTPRMSRE